MVLGKITAWEKARACVDFEGSVMKEEQYAVSNSAMNYLSLKRMGWILCVILIGLAAWWSFSAARSRTQHASTDQRHGSEVIAQHQSPATDTAKGPGFAASALPDNSPANREGLTAAQKGGSPDGMRKALLTRNRGQHEADAVRYDGTDLATLYEQSSATGGKPRERPDRAADDAFMALLTKYPDANATGMAVTERALAAAQNMDVREVESFYQMLRGKDAFARVVTDRGIEAVPTIQSFLAEAYLREGRTKEARTMVETMEREYAEGVVALPGPGGNVELYTVTNFVLRLRPRLNSPSNQHGDSLPR
jgi:hypothetical protein